MKKFLLLPILALLLLLMIYFNYQAMTEEKQAVVKDFSQQLDQPIPDFTPPAEISVDELEKEESEIEVQSPFKIGDEMTEAIEIEDEIEVEEDEIAEAEIGLEENLADEADENNEEDLLENIKSKINLEAVIRYSDISIARLEINGAKDNFIEGDEINGLLLKEITNTKVILSKNDEEVVVEMYD